MVYFFIGIVIKTNPVKGLSDKRNNTTCLSAIGRNKKDIQQNIQHHERYGDTDKKPDKPRGGKHCAIYLH